jgi:hypothetical protein
MYKNFQMKNFGTVVSNFTYFLYPIFSSVHYCHYWHIKNSTKSPLRWCSKFILHCIALLSKIVYTVKMSKSGKTIYYIYVITILEG